MQQVKNTHSADDTLSIAFPFATLENQLTLRNDRQFHPPLSEAAESAEHLILSCAPKSPSGARRTLQNEYF